MNADFAELIIEGYMTHPEDRAAQHRFDDLCDKFEAEGMTPAEAIAAASKLM